MWTPQSTAPARHWIQAIKIVIFIRRHHSPCSICLEEREKSRNRRVDLIRANNGRDIFLNFPARILLPKFVNITYETKIRIIHH
jgi:hypothetical protein